VLGRLSGKWSLVLIMTLASGSLRFGELKRAAAGVSQRMLTLTLRSLERDGIVARIPRPSYPLRVEYNLTELGRTLLAGIQVLATWAEEHRGDVARARERFDGDAELGAAVHD
jgi:DNA-binding HxlR family transcriptional regulator